MELSNPQHEAFARALKSGANYTVAAEVAGYRPSGAANQGSRLATRGNIQQRLSELPEPPQRSTDKYTGRDWITWQIVATHRKARTDKQHSVSVSCLQLLARIGGLLIEKRESYSERRITRDMSEVQLRQLLRERVGTLPEAQRVKLLNETGDLADVLEGDDATPSECVGSEAETEPEA